ncbi:hypothetical protein CO038_01210 [Candidatus Pacearchaeota archaeon CG_4_9_14_0_2_um_filter_39_13]|nr:MAG: hypothetical protein AUJ64_02630 [Candidatus Pacearchaeota archaeon CG1_02_39_14]PJC44909.1 MAG: hypothetical protein CO038_01210 [Candidatus Pacearchaeota archaeon CG_4_9_14_0_2_um_filter_39_13]
MPTIAISGQPSSGNTFVAKIISKKLGVPYFSTGQLFKDIGKGTYKSQHYYPIFHQLCLEKGISIPDFSNDNDSHAAMNIWDTNLGKSKIFHETIDELPKRLAEIGNIVIEGKLAVHMIPNAGLKIWLKASLEKRAERINFRDNLGVENARRVLMAKEKKEREEWKRIYGFDYFNQEAEADLVIDTSNLSAEEVAERILANL